MDQSLPGIAPASRLSLLLKYDRPGPRYTSYPTAPVWRSWPGHEPLLKRAKALTAQDPISLYLHIPYCDSQCYFCGCNMVVNKHRKGVSEYVDALTTEMATVCSTMTPGPIVQLHLGGGTPTYLTEDELETIFSTIDRHFAWRENAELGIEIDPRVTSRSQIAYLARRKFNRISFGVQDFDPDVQQTINRIQPYELTRDKMLECRESDFHSINIDLIYGLPKQSVDRFDRTLDLVMTLNPDRIALFNYAHIPSLRPFQKRFSESDIPTPLEKLRIFSLAHERFLAEGYVQIGMDHFAKPGDELSRAARERTLRRNFQGYSTFAGTTLLGFGVSAISDLTTLYSQNEKRLNQYIAVAAQGLLPASRGIELSSDDILRREIIHRLMGHFALNIGEIESEFGVSFDHQFEAELTALSEFESEGLISVDREWIRVSELGKLVIRNLVMPFDAYLPQAAPTQFSRTV